MDFQTILQEQCTPTRAIREWVAALAVVYLLSGFSSAFAQNVVPFVNQPLVPAAVAPRGAGFTLTVHGTGFVSRATVNLNDTPLATTFSSSSQLTATVPAAKVATAATACRNGIDPVP